MVKEWGMRRRGAAGASAMCARDLLRVITRRVRSLASRTHRSLIPATRCLLTYMETATLQHTRPLISIFCI